MKFLIVDDSMAMRKMVKRVMHQSGYNDHDYEFAENGKQAYDKVVSFQPDLVLCDWHMPIMDGIGLLNKVKTNKIDVKIGLVTTERSKERVQEAMAAGALFLVSKPFTPTQLADAVLSTLNTPTSDSSCIDLPNAEDAHEVIAIELDSAFHVVPCPIGNPSNEPYIVALFVDQQNVPRGLCLFDNLLTCFLGNALTNEPAACAYEVLAAQEIPIDLYNNCMVILKECGALFNNPANSQCLSFKMAHMITTKTSKLESIIASPDAKRVDFMVEVIGYGAGRMILSAF